MINKLIEACERLVQEIKKHNASFAHTTPESVIAYIEDVIRQAKESQQSQYLKEL